MNRKKRKSSRLRALSRRRQRVGQIATVPEFDSAGKLASNIVNRQFKRETTARIKQMNGKSLRQAARDHRRMLQTKARRVLRVIRKELKQALRRSYA